ncbi:MAG TPA: hypothetical protein QF355_01820 [Candidatus Marinimicrobia bacterium]|nr:hypothetical protein [Candidatus Neomarinimicrobiota bacterium]
MKKTIALVLFIQISMVYAQANKSFAGSSTFLVQDNNKKSLNLALNINKDMNLNSDRMVLRQKQMKSAARWLLLGTLVQTGGSFLVMTDARTSPHSHNNYGTSNMSAHSHWGFTPIIAAGSAINLIGIWKMYRAWK